MGGSVAAEICPASIIIDESEGSRPTMGQLFMLAVMRSIATDRKITTM